MTFVRLSMRSLVQLGAGTGFLESLSGAIYADPFFPPALTSS